VSLTTPPSPTFLFSLSLSLSLSLFTQQRIMYSLCHWKAKETGLYIILTLTLWVIGQPTYEKVNEELFLDKPLHVMSNPANKLIESM
jgi:hypothetical protein